MDTFEAKSTGRFGDVRRLELDLLSDDSVCVEAESDDERVIVYLEGDDLERLRDWCDAALKERTFQKL